MTIHEKSRSPRHYGRNALFALLALLAPGIAILWSWNTVVVDLYGQPEMQFRHAIAVEFLVVGLGALFSLPSILSGARQSEG